MHRVNCVLPMIVMAFYCADSAIAGGWGCGGSYSSYDSYGSDFCNSHYNGKPYWNRIGCYSGITYNYKQYSCGQTFDWRPVREGDTSPINRGRDDYTIPYGGDKTNGTGANEKINGERPKVFPPVPFNDASYRRTKTWLTLNVPNDSKVYLNNNSTRSHGTKRQYVSSPVIHGSKYHYVVLVRYPDGQESKRKITVKGGQHIEATFTKTEVAKAGGLRDIGESSPKTTAEKIGPFDRPYRIDFNLAQRTWTSSNAHDPSVKISTTRAKMVAVEYRNKKDIQIILRKENGDLCSCEWYWLAKTDQEYIRKHYKSALASQTRLASK